MMPSHKKAAKAADETPQIPQWEKQKSKREKLRNGE